MREVLLPIAGRVRQLEEGEDGLWYFTYARDRDELGRRGKPYSEWYEMSDFVVRSADVRAFGTESR